MDLNLYTLSALILFGYMTLWYLISLASKKGDVADIAWGLGFILISEISFFYHFTFNLTQLFTVILVTLWGLRLSIFIGIRNHNKPEDFRYKNWRENWKYYKLQAFLKIFMLQGALLYLISIPILWVNNQNSMEETCHLFLIIGIVVSLSGLIIEAVADQQKYFFKKKDSNTKDFIQSGLWKYSRHPNYFGEVVFWWGIFITVCSYTDGWKTIIGPLTITILILFVSGIPMAEEKHKDNEDYQEYKKKTSAFIPWFRKQ
jgi:steroid 5-alpha reductase family enzyme